MPVIVGAGFCPSGFWPDWAARFADQAAPPLPKYMSPLIWPPFTVPFIVMSIAPFCVCIENEMTIAFSLSEISTGTSPCGPEIDPASASPLLEIVNVAGMVPWSVFTTTSHLPVTSTFCADGAPVNSSPIAAAMTSVLMMSSRVVSRARG